VGKGWKTTSSRRLDSARASPCPRFKKTLQDSASGSLLRLASEADRTLAQAILCCPSSLRCSIPSSEKSPPRVVIDPRTRDTQMGGDDLGSWKVASISVVVLDPRIAPRDQATWAFTNGADAMAMAGFLNTRLGDGEEIAWVEVVPLARKLNKKALRYLDYWAQLAEDTRPEDERGE
jgi:hypothetical protein